MFTTQQPNQDCPNWSHQSRARHGQSIVVALLVLLLLGLVGALFVTIVARNLINTGKIARVQTAGTYAHAGITYADAQISGSADGADWRPPLQFALLAPPTEARELARYNANTPPAANTADPDLEYLQVGYARYNTGAGRFLVRVTYDPVNIATATVPPGKYLKIESIGREGVIDPNDPTTYSNNRSTDKTQSYEVAYKPIGITDYARFETNPDKRSDIANLGVVSQFYADNTDGGIATPGVFDFNSTGANGGAPTLQEYPVLTTYGAADAYMKNGTLVQPNPNAGGGTLPAGFTAMMGGGSIHSNMPVRFFGTNVMYLNPNPGANAPLFQDTAEFAGDLLLDSFQQSVALNNSGNPASGQQAALILNPTDPAKLATTGTYIAPSNSSSFNTQGGLVRDGSMQNDAAGLPRSITRLEPPLVDAQDTASQMPRYRAIAMNSAPRPNLTLNGSPYTPPAGSNPSQYGYGKAIYVNNPQDVQPDSASIGGGSTLTDEWLHRTASGPGGSSFGNWNGPYYDPPGVTVTLGQLIPAASGPGSYGIRLTRSGGHFAGPDGTTNAGETLDVTYADLGAEADNTALNGGTAPDNDIVIYAEGNVRVYGIASPNEGTTANPKYIPRHITIVSGASAYVEGNLLKGSPDSTISVLAHDYVCINTTQFLAGAVLNRQYPKPVGSSLELSDSDGTLAEQFGFGFANPGAPVTATTPQTPAKKYGANNLALYVSAAASDAQADGTAQIDFDILDPSGATVFQSPFVAPPGPPTLTFKPLLHTTFDLSQTTLATLTGATGDNVFQLLLRKDPGTGPLSDGISTLNPLLERVAVLPMDIRIEAVLYAQTRSFFVIPGEWFNRNSGDNLQAYTGSFDPNLTPNGTRPDLSGNPSPAEILSRSRFPLYGQPIDLKITIDGSVSEAHPADIAAQTEWMRRWGWIPQYHGSLLTGATQEFAGHPQSGQPAIGLQIIYDPQAGYPYSPAATNGTQASYYLRSDKYGRPLPFTPKLPVSPGLLYSGQSGEAPLLQ